jgi:hypothetical protein
MEKAKPISATASSILVLSGLSRGFRNLTCFLIAKIKYFREFFRLNDPNKLFIKWKDKDPHVTAQTRQTVSRYLIISSERNKVINSRPVQGVAKLQKCNADACGI